MGQSQTPRLWEAIAKPRQELQHRLDPGRTLALHLLLNVERSAVDENGNH